MFCSVIIPLYNCEAYIEAAINSVLSQKYQDFEVIVVDDGSTDNGPYLVSVIQDKRVQLLQQTNAGVSSARNSGVVLAKGDLICFLDADDWYHPLYLETIVSMALQHSEIGFFATNCLIFRKNDVPLKTWDTKSKDQMLIENLYNFWMNSDYTFNTSCVAVRREFLISFQPCFPLGESFGEDLDLWFRLAERSHLVYCKTSLVAYRHTEGSLSETNTDLTLQPVFSRIEQRVKNGQMPSNLRPSAIKYVRKVKVSIARDLLMVGRNFDACVYLLNEWQGIRLRSWWITVIMCVIFNPSQVYKWVHWRDRNRRD
jgi:glycosyltransferase involved in cell wall biosynthesis